MRAGAGNYAARKRAGAIGIGPDPAAGPGGSRGSINAGAGWSQRDARAQSRHADAPVVPPATPIAPPTAPATPTAPSASGDVNADAKATLAKFGKDLAAKDWKAAAADLKTLNDEKDKLTPQLQDAVKKRRRNMTSPKAPAG